MTPPAIDPRAQPIQIRSAALGLTKRCYVYLPMDAPLLRHLPVLYLLRGHEREWVNRSEDPSRVGTAIDVYEQLYAAGAVGPMLLVFPGLASDDNSLPSMLSDMVAPELTTAPGIGAGAFQRFFFDELLPTIERRFRTHKRARAVAGFSLGGLMAVKAAASRPDLFASVGSFDGTILYASDGGAQARLSDPVLANPMFDPALGAPRHIARIHADHPITALLRADRAAIRRLTWIVQYGPEAIEPWGSNFYRGEYLIRVLHALGISNAARIAALPNGEHTWRCADQHLADTLPIHWQALSQALHV
jgi:S-formylglutathione hydrolase FrmB